MGMTRLVIGTALGFMLAQAVLYGLKQLIGRLGRAEMRPRANRVSFARGSAFFGAFNKYAVLVAASAAVVTLGAWAVGDYLAAKAARSAAIASVADSSSGARGSDLRGSGDELAALAPPPRVDPATESSDEEIADPYGDSDFKVHRRPRRSGATLTLKETLLERSEAKARAELLEEMKQHATRSQYDCEAAVRADKYLKAGLDVWGFAAWQLKYFPMDGYKGATLAQCKTLKEILDPTRLNLQTTVAQQNQPTTAAHRETRRAEAVSAGSEVGGTQP
jgi:hypothetical protein